MSQSALFTLRCNALSAIILDMKNTPADQKRQDQARFIVQGARGWIKIWTKDGKPLAYGIESATRPNLFHFADSRKCSCEDSVRGHWCKHSRSVALWVRQVAAERKATQPRKLTPIRVSEDEVSWDRAARVAAYDRCFGEAA